MIPSALGLPILLLVGFPGVVPSLLRVTWTSGSAGFARNI